MMSLVDVRGGAGPSDVPDREEMARYHLHDETKLVGALVERAIYTDDERHRITALAKKLVAAIRAEDGTASAVDAFMREYGFTNEEGVILMCLAEALLRVPDADTADQLIAEKIGSGRWDDHIGHSGSLLVNASTWGLLLTGRIVKIPERDDASLSGMFRRLVRSSGEPIIRRAIRQAMRVMGDQFVLGETIAEAIKRADGLQAEGYRFSYDMLGEAARTATDSQRYFDRYQDALKAVGRAAGPAFDTNRDVLMQRPGLSIKLSALHPRFEPGREAQLREELMPRLRTLAVDARAQALGLTIDAEEQDRLDLSLEMFGELFATPELAEWDGLGLAVQAYGKRAIPALRWLARLSARHGKRIPVRLVKGAYWDSEIKWAQERGLRDYPVFTRKLHTDVSYLACVRMLLAQPDAFYPQFATHNAHTLSAVAVAGRGKAFEFQRLHGMGEDLYEQVMTDETIPQPCRIYAPVGGHEDLLAYLVRRLLENGANTSFINRLADEAAPIPDVIRDPIAQAEKEREKGLSAELYAIPRPPALFVPQRRNSLGLALSEPAVRHPLVAEMGAVLQEDIVAAPLVDGSALKPGDGDLLICPHDRRQRLGTVYNATPDVIEAAVRSASAATREWDARGGESRADLLEKTADLFERNRARLMAVMVREAGKTLENAQGDLREAVDFLRYYASEARRLFAGSRELPGPTGERNRYELHGRGPFACISPWNFPLAIFTGQVAGALAAGNPVLAKPAEQTPATAFMACQLFHEAGVPVNVLHLLPGDGAVGGALTAHHDVKGVVFTGSNETAWKIQKTLADRRGALIPFVAETGGINAMIVDSTALAEQVTRDVIRSAFDSAGQRCSATRVVFVQDDVATEMIEMFAGATELLRIGDSMDYATDMGPVIDADAQEMLEAHKARMLSEARKWIDCALPDDTRFGTFVSPAIFELQALDALQKEVFGPILHVIRYQSGHLDKVCEAINATGYGLTLGLHSRLERTADFVARRVRVGNFYVNRNQIGAVVGSQPFGGEGLSGTGPKAGGPEYIRRFATERVRTTDITATGGNLQLLAAGGTRRDETAA